MMSFTSKSEYLSSSTSAQPCHLFSLAEIQFATNDFDDDLIIGKGGFGKVYKGSICIKETSHVVAIKRLDSMSNQGATEFKAEIKMLSTLRHCNLVSLIGYCDENMEMILVYVYMPRGTLYDHLHKVTATPLSWIQRLKIAIGAGHGLDYLHTGVGTRQRVIHRDVKSSNILLDENCAAMISDFGLSKIGPIDQTAYSVSVSVKGTFGYLDPEYFNTRKLTRKTDVYAFGVLLFELLSGMLAVDKRLEKEHCSLARWAQKCVKEKKLDQMVDSNITGTIAPKCLRGFAEISYCCLLRDFEKRPSMTRVVAKLQDLLELQEKCDNSVDSSGATGFTWKIHKYLASANKQNSAVKNNMNQYSSTNRDLKRFTYGELESATGNFGNDTCLGVGSQGEVYKGWVDEATYSPCINNTGLPIVVRRLGGYKSGRTETRTPDHNFFKEFRHPNLVKLLGYCLEGDHLFLVHEFMNNGNFEDLLRSGAAARLPMVTKVKIAVGIARGVAFLNKTQYEAECYLRWGAKLSESRLDRHKILLDEDFTPKLSGYDVTKMVHGHYFHNIRDVNYSVGDYYPGFEPYLLESNLAGVTVLFREVITGKLINDEKKVEKIDYLLPKGGTYSLREIAEQCFTEYENLKLESEILTLLDEYERNNPA